MSTHPIERELKVPRIPPGTRVGPMNLPVSYNTKFYKLDTNPSGRELPKRQG